MATDPSNPFPIPEAAASPTGPTDGPPFPSRTPNVPAAGRDPEFGSVAGLAGLELDHSPESYLRLLANPFLGLAAILGWLGTIRALLGGFAGALTPMAVVLMFAALYLLPGLFHYHCLDCGRSGKLRLWKRHMCARVAERRAEGRVRRLRGPSPPAQLVLWIWALMALAVVFAKALHATTLAGP